MLQLISYFEGHGGAVTSLIKAGSEQSFYSAGSEGLIAYWQLSKPNEGEVLIKLRGLISAIGLELTSEILYAAVNHKGLFVIDIKLRKVLKTIEIPATSFSQIEVSTNYITLSTHIGELLIIDKKSLNIKKRMVSGLAKSLSFITKNDMVCYSANQEIIQLNMGNGQEKKMNFSGRASAFNLYNDKLIFASSKGLYVWNMTKNRLDIKSIWEDNLEIRNICINPANLTLLVLSKINVITTYKIDKKKISLLDTIQIEHNGKINDILWIENHKFVISAGADKKIGIWQLNQNSSVI